MSRNRTFLYEECALQKVATLRSARHGCRQDFLLEVEIRCCIVARAGESCGTAWVRANAGETSEASAPLAPPADAHAAYEFYVTRMIAKFG